MVFGKKGHAEIKGLLGQIGKDAILVSDINDLDQLDFLKPNIHVLTNNKKPQSIFKYCGGN